MNRFRSKVSKAELETQTESRIVTQAELNMKIEEINKLREIIYKTPDKQGVLRMIDEMMSYQKRFYLKEIDICKKLIEEDPAKMDVLK